MIFSARHICSSNHLFKVAEIGFVEYELLFISVNYFEDFSFIIASFSIFLSVNLFFRLLFAINSINLDFIVSNQIMLLMVSFAIQLTLFSSRIFSFKKHYFV